MAKEDRRVHGLGLTRHIHPQRWSKSTTVRVDPNDCVVCKFTWHVMVIYSYRFCAPVVYPSKPLRS